MLPPRKTRREMARKFGLVPEKTNFKKWLETTERTYKAGQAIHHSNLQDQHNKLLALEKAKLELKNPIEGTDNLK